MSFKTNAIDIEALSLRYGDRWLWRELSLSVGQGEKIGINGPSGSGKSSLLRCLAGLVKPQGGTIRLFGQTLDATSVWGLRLNLAYVAQDPEFGPVTARDALTRPFDFKANADLRGNLARIPSLLERFRLSSDLLDKSASALSGGERQRLAMVSALLLDRRLWLLDEITSGLDAENRRIVIDTVMQAPDLTVVSVSHDPAWHAALNRTVNLKEDTP